MIVGDHLRAAPGGSICIASSPASYTSTPVRLEYDLAFRVQHIHHVLSHQHHNLVHSPSKRNTMDSRHAQLCADVELRMKMDPLLRPALRAHWDAIGIGSPIWTTGTHTQKLLHLELVQLRLERQRFYTDRVGYSHTESCARVWHVVPYRPSSDYRKLGRNQYCYMPHSAIKPDIPVIPGGIVVWASVPSRL